MYKQDYKLDKLVEMVKNIIDQIQISNYSPENMDSPMEQYPATTVLTNKKSLTF